MFVYRPTDTYAHKHCLELAKCKAGPQDKLLGICEPIYDFYFPSNATHRRALSRDYHHPYFVFIRNWISFTSKCVVITAFHIVPQT
jgi:hypothetical protein